MLPHVNNSTAARDKSEPVFKSIFEVYFTLPEALRAEFAQDEALLTEHVQKISGLDNLYKGPEAAEQKFMGVDNSYLKPTVGETHLDVEITFSLNLRNGIDNYIYKLFRAWNKLGYDMETGERQLKPTYTSDWIHLKVGNRHGDVYHDVIMKDVFINGGITFTSDYEYGQDDALELTVKFRTDKWEERNA